MKLSLPGAFNHTLGRPTGLTTTGNSFEQQVKAKEVMKGKKIFGCILALFGLADPVSSSSQSVEATRLTPIFQGAAENAPIVFGGGKFVVASSTIVYTDDNGQTWREGEGLTPGLHYHSLAYGNGHFVAVTGTSKIACSEDAIHWSYSDSTLIEGSDVVFGGGTFVAVGTGAGTALWTATAPNPLPVLIGERLDSSRIKLTITVPENGTCRILAAPILPADSWNTVTTLTNISGQVTWTHTNLISGSLFYQLQKAD